MSDTGRCWGSWTMPRTVPKTVAKPAPANRKIESTNHKILRMRTLSPEKDESRGIQAAAGVDQIIFRRVRRVRRPRKRNEEEGREVRCNVENPRALPIRWANRWLSTMRQQWTRAERKQSR